MKKPYKPIHLQKSGIASSTVPLVSAVSRGQYARYSTLSSSQKTQVAMLMQAQVCGCDVVTSYRDDGSPTPRRSTISGRRSGNPIIPTAPGKRS